MSEGNVKQEASTAAAVTTAGAEAVYGPGQLSGWGWCQGCEEELVPSGERYCEFCLLIQAALDSKYASTRGRLASEPAARPNQPRVNVGVVDIGTRRGIELPAALTAPERGMAVAAAAALLGAALAAFLLVGWYGLRLIVAAGVAAGSAASR